jgi:hypothetical protein
MKIEKSHLILVSLFSALFIILAGILIVDSVGAENNRTIVQNITLIDNSQVQQSQGNALFLSSEITFSEINTEFSFNGFGLKWQNKDLEKNNCFLYVKTDKTDWQVVNEMEESSSQKNDYIFSDPIFLNGQKINLKAVCNEELSNSNLPYSFLQIIYFDSQPSYYFTTLENLKKSSRKLSGSDSLNIITRAEWGADENYRFWEPQYSDPKAFVIHHTAGSNGGDDPAATMRGIYYWHAVVLGWGDIGYNYLIDPAGNIYEGRYGGDKVIGAHTYNDEEDLNYNEGTIGISVLGCYEEDNADCGETDEFTTEAQTALENLIAHKAKKLKIKLTGKRTIFSKSIKSIVGHLDLDSTLCPGNIIEGNLDNIRSSAEEKYNQLVGRSNYQAKLVSNNYIDQYFINEENNVTVVYKNRGQNLWLADSTYLRVYNSTTQEEQKIYLEQDVESKDNATFNFSFSSGSNLETHNILLELYQQEQYIYKSRKKINIQIVKLDQAQFISHNIPAAILHSWDPDLQITYQNVGRKIWKAGQVKLLLNGKYLADLEDNNVAPGDNATFTFYLQSQDLQIGENRLVFYLKNGDDNIGHSRYVRILRID